MTLLDPALLAVFAPEFIGICDRLAQAPDAAAASRALAGLRGMAGAFGIASLTGLLGAIQTDPFDAASLSGQAAALRAQAAAILAAGRDVPPGAGSITVLIVDDSALMRRLLRDVLAAEPGFRVVAEAADGVAALALMAEHAPDVTLLDIEMPVMDGFGVLRRRALSAGLSPGPAPALAPGAVVVVSSAARPGSAAAVAARRLGAQAVVGKPSGAFSPDLADRAGAAIRAAIRAAVA